MSKMLLKQLREHVLRLSVIYIFICIYYNILFVVRILSDSASQVVDPTTLTHSRHTTGGNDRYRHFYLDYINTVTL